MNRFYIPPENWQSEPLRLTDREHHHCAHVMREKEGNRVMVFDGAGTEAMAEISAVNRDNVELKILQQTRNEPLPVKIALAQAIPKGKQMDLITQKAVELGAGEVFPLLSERTVVQLKENADTDKKQNKWQTVAIDAAKQCGRNYVPKVAEPCSMKEFLENRAEYDLLLIASLQPDARHLREILQDRLAQTPEAEKPGSVLVVVGPEGDFTPAESHLAKSQGFQPITLGPIILRSETAAIFCLSALSYELLSP
jgi:16S rRNA (uracil1498-N3)-methyltransferase